MEFKKLLSERRVRDFDSERPSATRHRRALEGYKLRRPPSYKPAFVRLVRNTIYALDLSIAPCGADHPRAAAPRVPAALG